MSFVLDIGIVLALIPDLHFHFYVVHLLAEVERVDIAVLVSLVEANGAPEVDIVGIQLHALL